MYQILNIMKKGLGFGHKCVFFMHVHVRERKRESYMLAYCNDELLNGDIITLCLCFQFNTLTNALARCPHCRKM